MEGSVELTVARAVQAMANGLARGGRDRRDAREHRESGLAAAPPGMGACIRAKVVGPECPLSRSPDEEVVDADALARPLVVRFREPGDVFNPLGAPGKCRLKDFFIDVKVPQWRRSRIPLVVDQLGIVWVVGYRIDDRVKVGPGTARAVRLSVQGLL